MARIFFRNSMDLPPFLANGTNEGSTVESADALEYNFSLAKRNGGLMTVTLVSPGLRKEYTVMINPDMVSMIM